MDTLFRNSRIKLSCGLLFWRELGKGIPIIFLHGVWHDSSQWLSVMESLSADFHCFAPDLLGFGESESPDTHYSIDVELECLAEFLNALKLEKVYLVGHSIGGWIATSYALKYPERVNGLVLLAPEGVEIQGIEKRWQRMQSLVKRPSFIFNLLRLFRPLTKALGWNEKIEKDWRDRQLLQQNPTGGKLLFLRKFPEINAELVQNRLSSIEVPILILQGGKDTKDALLISQTYARLATSSSLKLIAHGGNDLPESCAAVVAGDIRDFITGSGE